MTSARTRARAAGVCGVLALLALAAANGATPLENNDIWIHLTTGRLILEEGEVPRSDRYSFTAEGERYVAHEWLAATLYALGERYGGVPGVIVVAKLLPSLGIAAALLAATRAAGAPLFLALPLAVLSLMVGRYRTLARPELWAWVLLLSSLALLLRDRRGAGAGQRTHALWALIPIAALWANLHGSFPLGLVLVGVFAATEAAELVLGRRDARGRLARYGFAAAGALAAAILLGVEPAAFGWPAAATFAGLAALFALDAWRPLFAPGRPGQGVLRLGLLAAGMIAAMAANPRGLEIYAFPFEFTAGPGLVTESVLEWRPLLEARALGYSLMLPAYLGLLALAALALGLAVRRACLGRLELALLAAFSLLPWRHNRWLPIAALVAAPAVSLLLFRARSLPPLDSRWHRALALGFYAGAALTGAVAVWTLVFPPWEPTLATACALGVVPALLAALAAARPRLPGALPAVAAAGAALALALLGALHGIPEYKNGIVRRAAFGVSGSEPRAAFDFVARHALGERLLTEYHWAGGAIHALWPGVRVFLDSRSEVYGEALLREFREAKGSQDVAERLLDRHGVDLALLRYRTPPRLGAPLNPGLHAALEADPDWALVYVDDQALLYARRPLPVDVFVLRALHAWRWEPDAPDNARPELAAEVRRALEQAPRSAFLHYALAAALAAQARDADARAAAARAWTLDPRAAGPAQLAGELAAAAGERAEARRWFERAVAAAPRWAEPRRALARLRD